MRSVKILLFLTLSIFFTNLTYSQDQIPKLTGKISIQMKEGLIIAELKLINLPSLDTSYRILLNRGMNVKYFRDAGEVLKYNYKLTEDFLSYRIHNGKSYISLPKILSINYSGAFPVYTDTLSAADYKGIIAFNGKTMRASEQSKWYPVLYDTKNDREMEDVSYDVTVECKDCETIYLNGSTAQAGPIAALRSDVPFKLLLFMGDYQLQEFSNSNFLNAKMPEVTAAAFDAQIFGIKQFYEDKLGMPYQQKITFIQHTAIEPYGPNRSWGFVTFPSIAVAGGKFSKEIDSSTNKFNYINKYYFYAHELGHYYFGNILSPNSTLKWFFTESTAEYLSVKATEKAYGKKSTISYIQNANKQLVGKKIIALNKVSSADQIDESYRYSYGSLLLLALEKRVGEKKVYNLLKTALKHNGEKTDYAFLSKIAIESGISEDQWNDFEKQIIGAEMAEQIFNHLPEK